MLHKQRLISMFVLVALLFSACQPITAQSEPVAQPSDEDVVAAVNAIWREYEAAQIASDPDRWVALWTEDGVKMPPDVPALEGKEAIYARAQRGMTNAPVNEMVITALETQSAGDWAYSRGTFTVTYTIAETDVQELMDGKFMTILQRQPDGTWKIHRDIHNSNVPPAVPATAEEDVDMATVTESVNALWDEYEASIEAGDADRWGELWVDDGVKYPPDGPMLEGKVAIVNNMHEWMAMAAAEDVEITNHDVQVAGDFAFVRGLFRVDAKLKMNSIPVVMDGKYMSILQRQPGGTWKLYRDIFNSNVPPAPVVAPATDADAVGKAVDAIWREYEASLLAGDADRWINLWMEDGVQLPPGAPPVVGKEAIFAGISSDLETFDYTEFVITPEELVVNGDTAISRGNYIVTLIAKAGGDPITVDGKYMTLLRLQPDGSWKIYRDIFNSNVP